MKSRKFSDVKRPKCTVISIQLSIPPLPFPISCSLEITWGSGLCFRCPARRLSPLCTLGSWGLSTISVFTCVFWHSVFSFQVPSHSSVHSAFQPSPSFLRFSDDDDDDGGSHTAFTFDITRMGSVDCLLSRRGSTYAADWLTDDDCPWAFPCSFHRRSWIL
jgi:hypothetical protein